jgi:hypothetical protein
MILQVSDVTNDVLDDLALALYPHVFGDQRVSLITRLRPRMIGRPHPKRRFARMKGVLRLPVPNRGRLAGLLHAPPRARVQCELAWWPALA